MRKIIFSLLVFSIIGGSIAVPVQAEEYTGRSFEASVGESGLLKNVSFSVFENSLEIGFPAGRFSAPTTVSVNELNENITPPNGWQQSGPAYQIQVPADTFSAGPYYLSFKSSASAAYKQVYAYDAAKGWLPLEGTENILKGRVNATVTAASVRVAVFENPKILTRGQASWYRYKGGLFAASPDFPAGTKLRVINLDTKKAVDVIVNDHGPDRAVHPNRVVDIDAVAFARLAPLGQGTMKVAIEKLSADAPISPLPEPSQSGDLKVTAKAAVALNSADKKVLWSKNADAVMPLASLTKLVAVRTFLDTKPNMNKVVSYSIKDEQYNNKYVSPGESARLKLKDKDQVTVKDLVYSSLIGSTNNTVETLVRVSGMSRDQFIKKMNRNVADWGTKKTRFVEPTGLSKENVTTAAEYAIIAREVFLTPLIASATTRPSYSLTTINTKRSHGFKNTNVLARDVSSDLLGSKTGYLVEAGNCLVTKWPSSADKNLIVVVLGDPTRQASIEDTKTLLAYARTTVK